MKVIHICGCDKMRNGITKQDTKQLLLFSIIQNSKVVCYTQVTGVYYKL